MSQICFWNRTLHVSDSFFVHHQESSTVHTAIPVCYTGNADCLLAGSTHTHTHTHMLTTCQRGIYIYIYPAGSGWNILIPRDIYIYIYICIYPASKQSAYVCVCVCVLIPLANSQHIYIYIYADCLLAGSGSCSVLANSQHNLYYIHLLLCMQYQTPDDGQKICPKHVEFYSKNKFERLVHLVGFIIRMCHDARPSECQNMSANRTIKQFDVTRVQFQQNSFLCLQRIRYVMFLVTFHGTGSEIRFAEPTAFRVPQFDKH